MSKFVLADKKGWPTKADLAARNRKKQNQKKFNYQII